jgi:hypothetical protein
MGFTINIIEKAEAGVDSGVALSADVRGSRGKVITAKTVDTAMTTTTSSG